MPLGSPPLFSSQANASANVGTLVGGQAAIASSVPSSPGSTGALPPSAKAAPIALSAIIVLYLFWALVVRHEKVNSQLQPANVAINLHNIVVVGLTAMLFI